MVVELPCWSTTVKNAGMYVSEGGHRVEADNDMYNFVLADRPVRFGTLIRSVLSIHWACFSSLLLVSAVIKLSAVVIVLYLCKLFLRAQVFSPYTLVRSSFLCASAH